MQTQSDRAKETPAQLLTEALQTISQLALQMHGVWARTVYSSRGQLSLQALARLPQIMETCWHALVSLWKQYSPKWLAADGNSGIDSKHHREPPKPPDLQQLFQAADQETDRTVVLTGRKGYQVQSTLGH